MGRARAAAFLAFAIIAALLAPAPALAASPARFVSAHSAVAHYGPAARKRLAPAFRSAGVAYPPSRVVFAAIKSERVLEVYASRHGALRYVATYRILGASGHAGPKLREGDRQVPEGVYRISSFDANTPFHLAMLLDYPNSFDRAHARDDGRTDLGGDIYIHGSNRSTGCLAMGNRTAEDLFVLAADAGVANVKVVIAPSDPRTAPLIAGQPHAPRWLPALYKTTAREFAQLPPPPRSVPASSAPAASAAATATPASTAGARPPARPAGGGGVPAIAYLLLGGLVLSAGVGVAVRRAFSAVHERR